LVKAYHDKEPVILPGFPKLPGDLRRDKVYEAMREEDIPKHKYHRFSRYVCNRHVPYEGGKTNEEDHKTSIEPCVREKGFYAVTLLLGHVTGLVDKVSYKVPY